MDIQNLKEYILENNKIVEILEELGCHHIKNKDGYFTCGNPDGDNVAAITVYQNSNLTCVNYTRDIISNKSNSADIITLVEYFKKCSFFEAIKSICSCVGIDYYHDFDEDLPKSIRITKMIMEMQKGDISTDSERPLKPISEHILSYYKPYVNDMFYLDGIDYTTQKLFEIGYDEDTNRITIPIRDEIGNLVGVKGRIFSNQYADELKYYYIEPCARNRVLYGLNLTHDYIKRNHLVYVGESEKSVQQLWSMGNQNAVGIGGKKIGNTQIEKLTRLCVDICFMFDKDVQYTEIQSIANRFVDGVNIYAIIDNKNILDSKESPTDNHEKFERLKTECMCKIR